MSKNKGVNEITAIFGEVEVEGIKIKPWTLKQGVQLTSVLAEMVRTLQEKGIDLSNLGKETVDFPFIANLIEGIAPELPQIIAVTLRQDQAEVEEMELGKALVIGTNIFILNWNQIKNYFGQISEGIKSLKLADQKIALQ